LRHIKKLKIELPYDPRVILLLGTYLREYKPVYSTDTCTPMFIAALCTIILLWNQPKCSSTDNKENMVYGYNGVLFSHKEE
jgi:hypothetical protein